MKKQKNKKHISSSEVKLVAKRHTRIDVTVNGASLLKIFSSLTSEEVVLGQSEAGDKTASMRAPVCSHYYYININSRGINWTLFLFFKKEDEDKGN